MTTRAKIRKRQTYDWILRAKRAERAAQDRQAQAATQGPTRTEPPPEDEEPETETTDRHYVFTPPEKVELDELDPEDVYIGTDGVAFRCQFEEPSSWGNRTIWFRVPPEMVVPVLHELRKFAISQRNKGATR